MIYTLCRHDPVRKQYAGGSCVGWGYRAAIGSSHKLRAAKMPTSSCKYSRDSVLSHSAEAGWHHNSPGGTCSCLTVSCALHCASFPRTSEHLWHHVYISTLSFAPGPCFQLQVASGEVASAKIQTWVKREPRVEGMSIRVVTAAADSGSADAVRAVADKLTGDSVVVMSGDTVTDVSLPTVLFTHRIRGSAITTVLSKSTSSASESTKLGKAPKVCPRFLDLSARWSAPEALKEAHNR